MIELINNHWAFPLPDSAEGAEIRGEHPGRPYQLLSFYGEADAVDLPLGTWQIVCTSKEVTRMQASEIVEQEGDGFKDYSEGFHYDIPFPDPLPSFASLLTSKGCDLNKTYLILKKQ